MFIFDHDDNLERARNYNHKYICCSLDSRGLLADIWNSSFFQNSQRSARINQDTRIPATMTLLLEIAPLAAESPAVVGGGGDDYGDDGDDAYDDGDH